VLLGLHLSSEAGDRPGHHIARNERAGVERSAELFTQDDEVHQRLLRDTAPFELGWDEHGGPTERGALPPEVRVEDVGLFDRTADVSQRLVLGQETPGGHAQQLLILGEPEVHG
jgi:hypothetical protein